ncbi:retrovirus-related Pol polyprotein from transposon TNT 1-94 [Trichonephila clavipes]|nr:retrovirus-related Pol polyprotein from transposon TNT 1-94 [Trichonephila clavipes]
MKQDLEKAENAYLSSFTSKKSKTLPGATAAAHGDPNGKNDYQKKSEFDKGLWVIDTAATSHFCNDKSLFLDLKPITNMKMSLATEDKSCPVEGIGTLRFRPDHYIIPKSKEISFFSDVTAKTKNGSIEIWHQRFCHVNNDYLVKTSKNDSVKGLPRLTDNVSKTSTETPSTSEKPDVSSDNHSLIPCTEVKWIRNIGRKVTGSNVYYSIEGEATRLKSFNEIERYCKRHNIEYDPSLFNFRKDNTESQGFSDLSEQQEALMVEVTIPNCYKQAIRSRDASKWHDAMDKEINVMMERKVWDLVDHPDNIKILENRWVYTIKYDENNKIVRYKARLVARGNTQLRGESFDEVFQEYKLELSKVKSLKLRCYSDSDFATNRDDRVSMGGFITFIDETPISWRTFKQKSVSLSTMEADLELFFMNSVASTLNRVTGMEFNNQISVLTPNNWNTWKHDMQVLLMHYGCWQFIIQTKPEQPDEEATYKEKLDLQLRKDRCYTLIYTNISSDLKNLITETTDGVAAWKILKDHFEPVTKARVIQLLDQFFGTKYQPGEDVGIFISRVKTAATRLQEAGHKLDDLYIGFQLIRWLPQEFQSTVQQIYRWKEEDFRVVKIEAELILEANRLQLMKQDLEKAENAYLSSFTSKKSKTLPGATAAAHGDPNGKNDYQKKSEFDKGVWVIDTAATSHFCNDKSLFLDLKPITNMKMSLATEDKSCPVEGIGTLRFRPDHYIIPKSKEISFFSDVTAKTKNGSIEIWHQRFCHVNNDYLVKTSKNDSVKGLPRLTDNGKTHCIPCKLAKSKRVSFKKTGAVRSKRPLELLHMDLCGPMPTESQGSNKYFLSIIDDYSRNVTVFPIRNKSDVFHTFIRFQKRAERFLSKKVIAVRTDGGLEFCNKDMDNFLTELGIKHEVTNSYTPEMNGVAERFNLTALDGIKTLLKSSEVPHKFWGEALLCFTYAWNRICHKDSNKTPFEKYSGRKPSVLHLKPFGCLAYADENKLVETINVRFDENKRGINFRQKVNSNLGYNLNLPDYYDDEDDFDRVKDSLTSRLVSKTSTEMPSTSEKPDVSSDNHSLIPCTEVKWIRNIGRKVTGSNVYYSIEGEATRLKSFNEIERYCKRHNIEYDPSLFNFRKDNTESQGFSDLSEQQEALMVEVTIPNCYKQAIRSRDASKWHDAMDKEINVMKERKVWDLVDHPDNIKILENRWVYTIKYDENNKIVRYKARLVARGNTQLRGESFDEVFQEYKLELSKVKSLKLRCYSDSDFATNRDDRVSMGGFITFIDETPISWRTFKQKSVSLSTMEAEYVSLTEAAKNSFG